LFFIPWFDSFAKTLNGSFIITEIILLVLLADDYRLGKIRAPYVVALLLFIPLHITMNLAGGWAWWQLALDHFSAIHL
jgi:hypothetical protein